MVKTIVRILILTVCATGLAGPVGAQEPKPDPAMELYFNANGLYNRELYPLAIDQYRDFLKQYPKHEKAERAELGLGLSQFAAKAYKDAEPVFKKLASKKALPEIDLVRLRYAQCLDRQEKDKEAVKAFSIAAKNAKAADTRSHAQAGYVNVLYRLQDWKTLAKESSDILNGFPEGPVAEKVRYQCGMAYYTLKDYPKTVELLKPFETGRADSPFADLAQFLLAESYRASEDFEPAARLYEKVAAKKGGFYEKKALFYAGYCHFQRDAHAEAVKTLTAYVKLGEEDATYARGVVLLGRSHYETKNFAEAAKALAQGATIKQSFAEASLWLARTQVALKNLDEAEKVLQEASAKIGEGAIFPSLLLEYGNLLMSRDKFEDATTPYANFIQRYTDHALRPEAMQQRAYALHRAGKFADCIQQCEQFLSAYPMDPEAHETAFIRAESFNLDDKSDQAVNAFAAFIKDYPKSPRVPLARLRSGEIHYAAEAWAETEKVLEPLLQQKIEDPAFNRVAYLAGASAFKAKNWDHAVALLNRFVKEYPKEPNADLALMTCFRAQEENGQSDAALKTLTRFPGLFPNSKMLPQALSEIGRLHYEQKQYGPARQSLQQVLTQHKDSTFAPNALHYLAWIELNEQKQEQAAKTFGRLADDYPKHDLADDARLQEGLVYLDVKKHPEAEGAFAKFLLAWPKHEDVPQVLYHSGLALSRQEKWDQALGQFKQVKAGSEWHPLALYESAWAAKSLNRLPDATTHYATLVKRYPDHDMAEAASFELAKLQYDAGNKDAATKGLEALVKSVKERSLRDRALHQLGWCYFDQELFLKAATSFETLMAESPASTLLNEALFQAGESRLALKEFETAQSHYAKAAALERKAKISEETLLRLGETEGLVGRWLESERSYNELISLFPQSVFLRRAKFGLGWARENNKNYPKAIEAYRTVVAEGIKDETAARCQFQIGECYLALKEYDQAITELNFVEVNYDAYPKYSSKALLEMGVCLEKKGDPDGAKDLYREITQKYPGTEAAKVALKAL